jgi:hypothetical protein
MTQLAVIQNQLNRYTCAVNRQDWNEIAAVFAEQGTWECLGPPNLKFEGPEAIVLGLKENITRAKLLVQLNTPALIYVCGATASARSTMHEVAEFPRDDIRCEILGMYEDELIDVGGEWRFNSRRFTILELRNLKIEGRSQIGLR